jgi:hypothetical protein
MSSVEQRAVVPRIEALLRPRIDSNPETYVS